MFQKKATLLVLFTVIHVFSIGQTDLSVKPLSLAERSLLDFITSDTINPLSLDLYKENQRFGVSAKLANGVTLFKKKDLVYLQLMGSGRLYQIQKRKKKTYDFIRLDSTFHSGSNFGCINLIYKDTFIKLGGIGFWKIKDYFTYFSKKTHEWEFLSSKNGISVFQDPDKDLFFYTDESKGKFYLSNSINQPNFPTSLKTSMSDTCRVFDFKEKTWENLGKINPILKEIIQKSGDLKTTFGSFLIFHSDFELYWLSFSTNQFGLLVKNKQSEFREKWLKIYKGHPEHMYQFVMGKQFYLIRIEKNGDLSYDSIGIDSKDFVDLKAQPIYSNNFIATFLKKIAPSSPIIGGVLVVFMALSLFTLYHKKIKKDTTPIQVQSILYKNFYSALTIIEKELIHSMYHLQNKNEQISIKTINKIIGVQQKDTITQNKSRSDYFLRINQKFKLATRASEAFIVKERVATDKRAYNYNINVLFMQAIKNLILNN